MRRVVIKLGSSIVADERRELRGDTLARICEAAAALHARALLALDRPAEVAAALEDIDVLLLMVRRRGQVVTKDELLASIWTDTHVEESSLPVMISAIRRAIVELPADAVGRIVLVSDGVQTRGDALAAAADGFDTLTEPTDRGAERDPVHANLALLFERFEQLP